MTACEPCPEGTKGSTTVSGTCDVCGGLSQSVPGGAEYTRNALPLAAQ